MFNGRLERGVGVRRAERVLDESSPPPAVVLPRVDAPEVALCAEITRHVTTA